jgi:hypothetical protein
MMITSEPIKHSAQPQTPSRPSLSLRKMLAKTALQSFKNPGPGVSPRLNQRLRSKVFYPPDNDTESTQRGDQDRWRKLKEEGG